MFLDSGHTGMGGIAFKTFVNEGLIYPLDDSMFTLLFQDSNGGLQYLDRLSGTFVDAIPIAGVLYMNVGDMLERLSNGK